MFILQKQWSPQCSGKRWEVTTSKIWDNLRDLVPFVQKKKREKNPWGSVTFSKACNFTKSNNPPWVFFRFLNCKNGTKLCKTLHIYPANHKIDKDMSPAYFQERIILEIVLWRYANVTVTTGNTNMFKHSPQKVHKNLPPLQTHLAKRPTKFLILMLYSCCRYWM